MSLIQLEKTQKHTRIEFAHPFNVMSSAVLNGGCQQAQRIVNMSVDKYGAFDLSPGETIQQYCDRCGWESISVGMMTAASMKSLRVERKLYEGVEIGVAVTAGLSNCLRAGDKAAVQTIFSHKYLAGTINLVVFTSAMLSGSAMLETLMIATEAKAAAMQELKIMSPVSGKMATGTGTDAIAVASSPIGENIYYCGKHVLFGELVAQMTIKAIKSSVNRTEQQKVVF
ncbi:adenosylcobinamide amidohydrolase [Aliikangiella sp. G2MR2-5]|uniref:adenosylcobinamide amidohydrolase n=1 Tax=Aliikangiella sp. G2MR2-5 TaxID=2788943 RepID=UPI0018AAF01D|nr:adenosylcobinamide amidohydrolase [Aliikangiella sp. G2MR2-5]